MPNKFRIVFIGDVCGKPGRKMVRKAVPLFKAFLQPDIVIANGENSAGGLGITKITADELFESGIDLISGGNHMWDKREGIDLIEQDMRIVRPGNYPDGVPGRGSILAAHHKAPLLLVNIQGRVFMEPVVDNPFTHMTKLLEEYEAKIIVVDFHAEATAEKQAMGYHLDGKVSAVLGTHTHVPTGDLRILRNGTAFQSDVGMTGSLDSVIGMRYEPVLKRFLTGMYHKFEVAGDNPILDCSLIDVDIRSGRALFTKSFRFYEETIELQLEEYTSR